MIAALAPVGDILEVGSAPCHMTALLKLSGYAMVGVDERKLLRMAYRLAPRRFRREIVIVAHKAWAGPRLAPLVPVGADPDLSRRAENV